MEGSDFLPFLSLTVFVFIPFAWIYLILYTLNWNEKKNLFLDSWVVFLAFIFSCFGVWLFCLSPEFGFYKLFSSNIYVTFFPFAIFTSFFSIAIALKTRQRKRNLSIVGDSDEIVKSKNTGNIWLTSLIVSILTLAMMTGLVMFVGDISKRVRNETKPKSNGGYISF